MQNVAPTLHVALPAMNESGYIEDTLRCLQQQKLEGFHTWVCVNQPESFWNETEKVHICLDNKRTLKLLKNYQLPNLHILDYSSQGHGWQPGRLGVGMARKILVDQIMGIANDNDVMVSLDADTLFGENYLASVLELFRKNQNAVGLANPYYHPLVDDEKLNRAILRYEIYMRYYALNMRLTCSPYFYTALGSAMAAPVWACKKIGGLTPKKSGEDFYFLQKLTKSGWVIKYNTEVVYPGTRISDRVFFGTGPAMIKGLKGQWFAYPLFDPDLFDMVRETISLFPFLFEKPQKTPMDPILREKPGCTDVFEPLRKNCRSKERFVRACHEKVDGLRILQFLKSGHKWEEGKDEKNLRHFLQQNFDPSSIDPVIESLNFSSTPINDINKIRKFLFEKEMELLKQDETSMC